MVSLTYVIVTDMVTLRERGKWFSLITLQWAIGSVGAPVIGGAIAEHANWRWLFWLNFPFIAIAFVGIPVCLKLTFRQTSMWAKVKRFDWAGSGLFVASLTSFLVPLTWGGIMYDWSSYHTLVPMLVGVVGLITFFLWQKFFSPEPLIRGSIFLTSTAKVGYLGTFLHGILTWSMLYYQPLYYEAVQGFGPTKAGIAIFPVTFTVAPSAVVVGLIIAKTGRYRPSIYIGWVLCTLGAGLLTLQGSATTTVQWIFLTLVVGVGAGILFSAQSFAVQASASNADLPFAGAMYSFFRALGQTFGVAMGGVIFQNQFRRSLERSTNALLQGNASEWARNAMAFVEVLRIMPEGKVKTLLVEAYVDGLRMVWIVMCALCGIALVLSLLFTKDISLERPLETEQAFIHDRKAPCVEEAVSKGES
jgi:MFS family permease